MKSFLLMVILSLSFVTEAMWPSTRDREQRQEEIFRESLQASRDPSGEE
jgi:hypothetical protein